MVSGVFLLCWRHRSRKKREFCSAGGIAVGERESFCSAGGIAVGGS